MFGLPLIELEGDLEFHALSADDGRHAHDDVLDPEQAHLVIGYGHDGFLVPDDRFADPLHRRGNAEVRRSFLLDDLVGAVAHVFFDLLPHGFGVGEAAQMEEVIDRYAGNIRRASCGQFTIAVFADDACVHMARVDIESTAEGVLEACAVEDGA